jgi:hypothetical protein
MKNLPDGTYHPFPKIRGEKAGATGRKEKGEKKRGEKSQLKFPLGATSHVCSQRQMFVRATNQDILKKYLLK